MANESLHVTTKNAPGERVWSVSIKDILRNRPETLNPEARFLIYIISILHPERIPRKLFEPNSPPEDLKDIGLIQDFDGHITELSTDLVHYTYEECGTSYLNMHTSLRDVLQDEMSPQSRQAAFDTVIRLLCAALDPSCYSKEIPQREIERQLFLEYFSHIESVRQFFEHYWQPQDPEVFQIPRHYILLLSYSSRLCYSTGSFQDGLVHLENAKVLLEALERYGRPLIKLIDPNEATTSVLKIWYNHASIATEIGDFALSLELFEKQQRILDDAVEKGFVDTNEWMDCTLGGIANSYQGLGDHDRAEVWYKKCLEVVDPDNVHSPYRVNYCRSLLARGALTVASDHLEQLIELREKRYGKEDTKDFIIGHMKYVLGNVRIDQNRLDEAFELHKSALNCWRQTQELHHKTGDAWHKVGWHYARLGLWDEAKSALESALHVYTSGKDVAFRKGEIARITYKLSEVLKAKATQIRSTLSSCDDMKHDPEENEGMYDAMVSLWAR